MGPSCVRRAIAKIEPYNSEEARKAAKLTSRLPMSESEAYGIKSEFGPYNCDEARKAVNPKCAPYV